MEVQPVVKDGVVNDWEMLEQVWNHALSSSLRVSLEDRPVMIAEKSYNSPQNRHK